MVWLGAEMVGCWSVCGGVGAVCVLHLSDPLDFLLLSHLLHVHFKLALVVDGLLLRLEQARLVLIVGGLPRLVPHEPIVPVWGGEGGVGVDGEIKNR